jgi:hypothetical protein
VDHLHLLVVVNFIVVHFLKVLLQLPLGVEDLLLFDSGVEGVYRC